MFAQEHVPGREGAFDFTDATELGVTIAGEVFAHLFFQFVLSFSKWRWIGLAYTETFEALVRGLQGALWELGGVPSTWRSDNLSAATHQIPGGGREVNRRFAGVLDHRIDYRHVIWSLVRKPGRFARYVYREEMFPSVVFRRA